MLLVFFFFLDTLSEVINEEKVGESENVVSVLSFERFFKFLKIYIKLIGIIMRFVIFSFLSLNACKIIIRIDGHVSDELDYY